MVLKLKLVANNSRGEFNRIVETIRYTPWFAKKYGDYSWVKFPQFKTVKKLCKILLSSKNTENSRVNLIDDDKKEELIIDFKKEVYPELKLLKKVAGEEEEFNILVNKITQIPNHIKNGSMAELEIPIPYFRKKLEEKLLAKIDNKKLMGLGELSKYEENLYFNLFKEKYHLKDVLINHKSIINDAIENFKDIIDVEKIFKTLNDNWKFKIAKEYKIILTAYGTCGSYNSTENNIIIRCADHAMPFSISIFHEAIHIGIEKLIIQKYKLNQMEKERIVDLICKNYIGEEYRMQSLNDKINKKIDNFITADIIENNLPLGVENYLKSKE